MDSSKNPEDDDIDNMSESEQSIPDNETESDTTNQNKRKKSPTRGEGESKPKKQVQERSDVWESFTRLKDNPNKCKCHYCGREMSCRTTSGTSNLKMHLTRCKKHQAYVQAGGSNQLNRECDGGVKYGRVSEVLFKEASTELLVLGELPLSFIESLAWRNFCSRVKLYRPQSRRTVTRDIVQMYAQKKEEMRNLIGKQRVSLTTDIWTAPPTGASYMVITAHWIDANWQLKKLIIGFKNVSDHKGETIASVLIECLADWRIKKVFTITVDNATANTLAIRKFKEEFTAVGNDALVLGGEFLHMRCAAHIINLVVKDGLKEVDSSVSAIRNAITYVRSSTERLKSFELRVDNSKMSRGSLPLDVKTRWNSTYLILTRALNFKLAFDKMKAEDKVYNDWFDERVDGGKRLGPPTMDNWESIDKLVKFLRIFYHSTLVVSASESVSSYNCYAEIVTIERNLIALSKDRDKAMRDKASAMRQKFDKYWAGLKEINPLLIVASVLSPTNKMCFATLCFEDLYGKGSRECNELDNSVNQVMKRLFKEYSSVFSKSRTRSSGLSQTQTTATSSQSVGQDQVEVDSVDLDDNVVGYERIQFVYKKLVKDKGIPESSNELELYLKESVENPNVILGTSFDVLSWWRLNAPKYPILSEIAKDVFAMQVSSVASESAFSTSGRVLDPSRSCLHHYTLEVLMCAQQWIKSSIHLKEKGAEITTQEILSQVELQDQLEKEFDSSFQNN